MLGQTGPGSFVGSFTVAVLSILILGPALSAYARRHLHAMERLLFGISSVLLFGYLISKRWEPLIAGLILGALLVFIQKKGSASQPC
jgi:hypothetical protein